MLVEMKMPDLSTAGTTVKILTWLVKPGQTIKRGQILFEVETDKASMEVESYLDGKLVEIKVPDDMEVEVGQTIAIIENENAPVMESSAKSSVESNVIVPNSPPTTEPQKKGGMFARNRQRTAHENTSASAEDHPKVNQRVVGQRMLDSKLTKPHFYLQTSANAQKILDLRQASADDKPAIDAYLVLASARALEKYPGMKVALIDGELVTSQTTCIGVAVDLPGGLFVAPILSPITKTVEQISTELRSWVTRLSSEDPEARKIQTANFTITNLGSTGIESFIPIINPPETAILAAGAIKPVVVSNNGRIETENRINLTLSVDHRVVNGRYAADFLQAIVKEMESIE